MTAAAAAALGMSWSRRLASPHHADTSGVSAADAKAISDQASASFCPCRRLTTAQPAARSKSAAAAPSSWRGRVAPRGGVECNRDRGAHAVSGPRQLVGLFERDSAEDKDQQSVASVPHSGHESMDAAAAIGFGHGKCVEQQSGRVATGATVDGAAAAHLASLGHQTHGVAAVGQMYAQSTRTPRRLVRSYRCRGSRRHARLGGRRAALWRDSPRAALRGAPSAASVLAVARQCTRRSSSPWRYSRTATSSSPAEAIDRRTTLAGAGPVAGQRQRSGSGSIRGVTNRCRCPRNERSSWQNPNGSASRTDIGPIGIAASSVAVHGVRHRPRALRRQPIDHEARTGSERRRARRPRSSADRSEGARRSRHGR